MRLTWEKQTCLFVFNLIFILYFRAIHFVSHIRSVYSWFDKFGRLKRVDVFPRSDIRRHLTLVKTLKHCRHYWKNPLTTAPKPSSVGCPNKVTTVLVSGWLSLLTVCLWLWSWSRGPRIRSQVPLLSGEPTSLSPSASPPACVPPISVKKRKS